jgi:3-deoxy-D-manno-octulosonate 8-phosphate phosphatase (KDO 8-P phosphatase)
VPVFDAAEARRVRILGLDVDGVLTDNAVFIGEVGGSRVEFKRFDIQDGLGLVLLRNSDIEVVWISGRQSAATAMRAAELRIAECVQVRGARKVPAFAEILERRGLSWQDAAFVGDDLADLPLLRRVGLPIAVANAVDEVKRACRHVTNASGGHGAVREVVDGLLRARGEWHATLDRYLAEASDARA